MRSEKISEYTVRRLSHYFRFLADFEAAGKATVSSGNLAEKGGWTSAQVRKDLSLFGSFGKRGLGYSVPELRARIAEILGLGRRWKVCLVGAGKLGSALFRYEGFRNQGFDFMAVFDNDPRKIGRRRGAVTVEDVARLGDVVVAEGIEIGIIATPAESAQKVADTMVEAGIEAILNFAPLNLVLPSHVSLHNVRMLIELESLSFALTNKEVDITRS